MDALFRLDKYLEWDSYPYLLSVSSLVKVTTRASLAIQYLGMTCRLAAVIPHGALLGLGDNLLSIVQQQTQWKCCSDVQESWKAIVCNSAGWCSKLPEQAGVPAGDPPWEVTEMGTG